MKLDINYQDVSFEDLTENIFNNEPQEKSSIPISFDNNDLKDMHEALIMFFTKGMKKKFGNEKGIVDLLSLKKSNYDYINEYFNSISINMNYCFYTIEEYDKMIFNHFSKKNFDSLQDYCFKIKIGDNIFVLWFNLI
jgi:hypothetical protein